MNYLNMNYLDTHLKELIGHATKEINEIAEMGDTEYHGNNIWSPV